jgi:hypothetical protein
MYCFCGFFLTPIQILQCGVFATESAKNAEKNYGSVVRLNRRPNDCQRHSMAFNTLTCNCRYRRPYPFHHQAHRCRDRMHRHCVCPASCVVEAIGNRFVVSRWHLSACNRYSVPFVDQLYIRPVDGLHLRLIEGQCLPYKEKIA